jgi:hypothetical protein
MAPVSTFVDTVILDEPNASAWDEAASTAWATPAQIQADTKIASTAAGLDNPFIF